LLAGVVRPTGPWHPETTFPPLPLLPLLLLLLLLLLGLLLLQLCSTLPCMGCCFQQLLPAVIIQPQPHAGRLQGMTLRHPQTLGVSAAGCCSTLCCQLCSAALVPGTTPNRTGPWHLEATLLPPPMLLPLLLLLLLGFPLLQLCSALPCMRCCF
jgi:hypothetical protein